MKSSNLSLLWLKSLLFTLVLTISAPLLAGSLADGKRLYDAGQYRAAADALMPIVRSGKSADDGADALLYLAFSLEKLADLVNREAEQQCYRRKGAPRSAACMRSVAGKYNTKYGAGSFVYDEALVVIRYTGRQYDTIKDTFPGTEAANAADYYQLTKHVVGDPKEVLARVKAFEERHPDGEWYRKGRLLEARLNEDVWWIHLHWWWLLYNWNYSQDEMTDRAEPYRQEAMRIFSDLTKRAKKTDEGRAAVREYKLLKKYQTDGVLYGIVSESLITNAPPPPTK